MNEYQIVHENARPAPAVVAGLVSLGRQSWNFWQAVSELIDNTITFDGNTHVNITIDTVLKTFRIKDDSIGIPGEDLLKVFTAGKRVNKGKGKPLGAGTRRVADLPGAPLCAPKSKGFCRKKEKRKANF